MLKQILDILNVVWRYLILLALAVAVYYVFNRIASCNRTPAIVAEQHAGIAVDDSLAALQIIRADNHKLRDNLNSVTSRLKEALGLIVRPFPTGYSSRIDPMPGIDRIVTVTIHDTLTKRDTTHHYFVSNLDVPISLIANSDIVRIVTRNSYNASQGQPFSKIYRWPRHRKDFALALYETTNWNKLDGITMMFTTRAFEWEGFGGIAGLAFPHGVYLGVDARATFWERLQLSPRAEFFPELGSASNFRIEARLRF